MKIAIVGCGWLGFPLSKTLIKNDYTVIGSTTSTDKIAILQNNGIEPILWSLGDEFDNNLLQEIDVLVINIPPSKTKNALTSYSNNLVNLCKNIHFKTKVLLVSTTGVYPDNKANTTSSFPFKSMDQTKETVLAEIKLKELLENRITILRLSGLIGPSRHPITSLSKKGIVSNGNAPLNLIHLNDVIGIISRIIENKFWGEIVNGCFPEHPSKKEYYQKAAEYFKLEPPQFLEGGDSMKIVNSKSRLNYKYTTSIYEFDKI